MSARRRRLLRLHAAGRGRCWAWWWAMCRTTACRRRCSWPSALTLLRAEARAGAAARGRCCAAVGRSCWRGQRGRHVRDGAVRRAGTRATASLTMPAPATSRRCSRCRGPRRCRPRGRGQLLGISPSRAAGRAALLPAAGRHAAAVHRRRARSHRSGRRPVWRGRPARGRWPPPRRLRRRPCARSCWCGWRPPRRRHGAAGRYYAGGAKGVMGGEER